MIKFYETLKNKKLMEIIDNLGAGKIDSYEAYKQILSMTKKSKPNKEELSK
jgi:hypothetical protein